MILKLIVCAVAVAIVVAAFVYTRSRQRSKNVWDTTSGGPYELIISKNGLSCRHSSRPDESISWKDINEIRYVATSDGPYVPDKWIVFIGDKTACSVPFEAKHFDQFWNVFKERFPDLDYSPILKQRADDAASSLWKRQIEQGAAANP